MRDFLGRRVAAATNSPDLRGIDVDVATAMGMAAAAHPKAVALMRLKYGRDRTAYGEALSALVKHTHTLARIDRYRIDMNMAAVIAGTTLEYWLDPRCVPCAGRGHLAGPKACPRCNGTGDRGGPAPRGSAVELERIAGQLLAWIQRQESRAGAALMRKLAEDMRGFKP